MLRRHFLLVALAAVLAGCGPATGLYHERVYVFGTLVDVSLWGVTEAQGRQAIADLDRTFQAQHVEWHAWKPGALTDLNAALARGEPGRATPHLARLVEISTRLSAQSDGLFNPALGHLIRLWGFHNDELPTGPPPPRSEIEAWLARRPRMADVAVEGEWVRPSNPAVMLDFGAIAKGYAVDLAVERLRALGIRNALVNAGGGMTAMGRHADRPWRVGVRHPQGKGVLAALELNDGESVHTSGNYERPYGQRTGRINALVWWKDRVESRLGTATPETWDADKRGRLLDDLKAINAFLGDNAEDAPLFAHCIHGIDNQVAENLFQGPLVAIDYGSIRVFLHPRVDIAFFQAWVKAAQDRLHE